MGQVEISGKTYEIYGTLDDAETYFSASLNKSGWAAADFTTKQAALVTASRMFDRTLWAGTPTLPVSKVQPQPAETQPLAWPRQGTTDCSGDAVPDDVIPEDVIAGSFELANALLVPENTIETSASSGSNVKKTSLREKVDVLETAESKEYFINTARPGRAPRFPQQVHELIRCFLGGSGAGGALSFGLNDDSAFDNEWGLTIPGFY